MLVGCREHYRSIIWTGEFLPQNQEFLLFLIISSYFLCFVSLTREKKKLYYSDNIRNIRAQLSLLPWSKWDVFTGLAYSLFPQSHQWQGRALKGAGKLTWLSDGSETGAVGGILVSLIMGRFTWHRACWRQVESGCLKGAKGFLPMSWRGSSRGL